MSETSTSGFGKLLNKLPRNEEGEISGVPGFVIKALGIIGLYFIAAVAFGIFGFIIYAIVKEAPSVSDMFLKLEDIKYLHVRITGIDPPFSSYIFGILTLVLCGGVSLAISRIVGFGFFGTWRPKNKDESPDFLIFLPVAIFVFPIVFIGFYSFLVTANTESLDYNSRTYMEALRQHQINKKVRKMEESDREDANETAQPAAPAK